MGEYVWTTITIGGRASRAALDELAQVAEEEFGGTSDTIAEDIEGVLGKATITFEGNRNYGNADEFENWCLKHELPYVLTWCAASGAFGSGIHYWHPGMEQVGDFEANDEGDPSLSLDALKLHAGKSVADVIAMLERADARNLPPLEWDGTLVEAEPEEPDEPAAVAEPDPLPALKAAEAFMSGFEDDPEQEGIAERLADVRSAIAGLEGRTS